MILYLDFDGVLHNYEVYLDHRNRPYLRGMGELFEHNARLEQVLDPYPQVKIVLSTSWVRTKGFSHSCKRLPLSLRQRVVGATWHSRMQRDDEWLDWWIHRSSRYEQILRDVTRRQPEDWMALDDDVRGWPAQATNHLIACDSELGLGGHAARLALEHRLARRMPT